MKPLYDPETYTYTLPYNSATDLESIKPAIAELAEIAKQTGEMQILIHSGNGIKLGICHRCVEHPEEAWAQYSEKLVQRDLPNGSGKGQLSTKTPDKAKQL